MAAKSKDRRPIIKLRSTADTGYTYVTRKNKINSRERLELKKDRKSTRLNSSHSQQSRMPSSA